MDKMLKITIIFFFIRIFLHPWDQVFSSLPEQELAQNEFDSKNIYENQINLFDPDSCLELRYCASENCRFDCDVKFIPENQSPTCTCNFSGGLATTGNIYRSGQEPVFMKEIELTPNDPDFQNSVVPEVLKIELPGSPESIQEKIVIPPQLIAESEFQ